MRAGRLPSAERFLLNGPARIGCPGRSVPAETKAGPKLLFTYALEHEDGSPAEPATFHTAVSNWRLLAILAKHVSQSNAECLDLDAEPVKCGIGLVELLRRLLAGGQEKDQRGENSVAVGGDVDSFRGALASEESRSGTSRIKA